MRFLFLAIATLLILAGCANMGKAQMQCEKQYQNFADIVQCTKNAFADNARVTADARTRAYFLRGDQLVDQIKRGKISELDAKVEWQKMYLELGESERLQKLQESYLYGR
jgi:ABC-type uncharacterized transport system auxiliary subunit